MKIPKKMIHFLERSIFFERNYNTSQFFFKSDSAFCVSTNTEDKCKQKICMQMYVVHTCISLSLNSFSIQKLELFIQWFIM